MKSQTLRAIEAILEADPGISEKHRRTVMGVLRGELPTPSDAPVDLVAQVTKLLETVKVPKTHMRREEAAEYLGCSIRQIDQMKHDGDLPFCKLGGRLIIFKRADLDRVMEESRIAIDEA